MDWSVDSTSAKSTGVDMYIENSYQSCDHQLFGYSPSINRILRLPTLLAVLDISAATLWRWVKDKSFPQPVSLGGRSIGWLESEVNDWIKARAALRNQSAAVNAKGVQS